VQNHSGGVSAISTLDGRDGTRAFEHQDEQGSKPKNILNGSLLGSLGSTIKK
jgi:cytochrome b involved in lipid metabolism